MSLLFKIIEIIIHTLFHPTPLGEGSDQVHRPPKEEPSEETCYFSKVSFWRLFGWNPIVWLTADKIIEGHQKGLPANDVAKNAAQSTLEAGICFTVTTLLFGPAGIPLGGLWYTAAQRAKQKR